MELKTTEIAEIKKVLTAVSNETKHAKRCPYTAPVVLVIELKRKTDIVSIDREESKMIQQIVYTNCNELCPLDRKSTRLNSSHIPLSRMPSSA